MPLQFTIIDYTIDKEGVSTVVNEPVGWDSVTMRIKRDKTWHGFFDFFDDSYSGMQWHGVARTILNSAYLTKGVEADCHLRVDYACSETDAFEQVYLGKFVFTGYSHVCGDVCYATCGVENTNCLMKFRNRYDQKVDLDSLVPMEPCQCNDSQSANGGFSGHIITITDIAGGPQALTCIKPGNVIEITGAPANNGSHTIVNSTLYETYAQIEVTGELIDAPFATFTISGCLFASALPAYAGLNKPVMLPSQPIMLVSEWKQLETTVSPLEVVWPYDLDDLGLSQPTYTPAIPVIRDGINATLQGTGVPGNKHVPLNEVDKFIDFRGFNLKCGGPATFAININFNLLTQSGCDEHYPDSWRLVVVKAAEWNDVYTVYTWVDDNVWAYTSTGSNLTVNDTIHIDDFNQGDKLWVFLQFDLGEHFYTSDGSCFPDLQVVAGSSFVFEYNSICEDTPANLYLINEVMSRCTESYTNDCMRVYSNYYGRKDAKPYPSDIDGCGGNRGIATGLIMRNALAADGVSRPRMTISMKECFEALAAIDNIGMGVEEDLNRDGHDWIRVEPVEHFYNNTVLMECTGVNDLTTQVDQQKIYSTFKCGYSKFETWNNNGLYDFFSTRQYRTEISTLQNELDQVCKWIASNYAIEITRRLYGSGSSDWRYDNDIFIVCLKTHLFGLGGLEYTQFAETETLVLHGTNDATLFYPGDQIEVFGMGQNGLYTILTVTVYPDKLVLVVNRPVSNETGIGLVENKTRPLKLPFKGVNLPENILFAGSMLNYSIAPTRNAMRWLKTVLQSYRNFETGALRFTNGSGNLLAKGMVGEDGCILEAAPVTENQDITLDTFATPAGNYPLYWPELVKFEYPVTWQQYKNIRLNPYGLIGYQCGTDEMQYGWIEDFQLKPYTGMGQFTLRPKIT